MEANQFLQNSSISEHRILGVKRRKDLWVSALFKWILIANYSISILINGWRVQNYISTAIRITSFEFFCLLMIIQYLIYPRLKNKEDVLWFCAISVAQLYFTHGYLYRFFIGYFKNYRIKEIYQKNRKGWSTKISGIILFIMIILIFVVLTVKEIYDYHTRFFWWN